MGPGAPSMPEPAHTSAHRGRPRLRRAERTGSAVRTGLLALAATLAGCGSVTLFSEDPVAARDRASRFDRFVEELDLALLDTAPVLDQVRAGAGRVETGWAPERCLALRRAVLESAAQRLDREFAPSRLDDGRAVTSRVLREDLRRAAGPFGPAAPPLTPWSGTLVEAPSVLGREQQASNEEDLAAWVAALHEVAREERTDTVAGSVPPATRDAELARRTAELLERIQSAITAGPTEDPLLGPLEAARRGSNPPWEAEGAGSPTSELGLALGRCYGVAAARWRQAAATPGASGALEGDARTTWLRPLHESAGMEASPERLTEIARAELDRLTVDLARAAGVLADEAAPPADARLALRALRSGDRPIPGGGRPPREPAVLWSGVTARLTELIASPPTIAVEAANATPFERPLGRWSPFVPGGLVPEGDPRARPARYLAAPAGADFQPDWLRDAEAWRDGVPGRAVADAYRRAAEAVPLIVRRATREAFEEGWALYAVDAAAAAGLLMEVDGGFGRVTQELCAFAAMLTDLGVNHEGWTRQQAADFVLSNTPLPPEAAELIVLRCLAHPGRAALPAVGLLRFRALRRGVEAALDERFDARSFHAALLEGGPIPMGEVDGRIQRWLERGAPSPD